MSEVQDQPFSAMLKVFRRDADDRSVAPWRFGIVRSLSPLAVEIGGQTVTSGVYANSLLLSRNCSVALSGLLGELQGSPEDMAVSSGTLSGTAALGGIIAPGDRVVLLQSGDGQEYVILCKAVSG